MKRSINKQEVSEKGILYVLQLRLEEKELIKVGVTCRKKVEERVCEILTSIWKRYRIFPECYVKRYRTVDAVYNKETQMHKLLQEYKFDTKHAFSGSTEIFKVDIDIVTKMYEEVTGEPLHEADCVTK